MTQSSDTCLVCGIVGHVYREHMAEVDVPAFVSEAVGQLRELEMSGSHIDGLVGSVKVLVVEESGGRRAWAIWLRVLLEEIEDAADAPDVAAEIEDYLIGGFSS